MNGQNPLFLFFVLASTLLGTMFALIWATGLDKATVQGIRVAATGNHGRNSRAAPSLPKKLSMSTQKYLEIFTWAEVNR